MSVSINAYISETITTRISEIADVMYYNYTQLNFALFWTTSIFVNR